VGAGETEHYAGFNHLWGWSYGNKWYQGMPNSQHYYINGQGRMGTNPFDHPELYWEQSALTHVRTMNQPLLIMHGSDDAGVNVMEGLQFYNGLRFYGKNVIMLVYPGELHGLQGLANRRDFTIRAMQFFDHYLRGVPAPRWMTEGVPFLEKKLRREPK
jgi:dipeptidyl aminopeptidase/acylaminoacyl peptidase